MSPSKQSRSLADLTRRLAFWIPAKPPAKAKDSRYRTLGNRGFISHYHLAWMNGSHAGAKDSLPSKEMLCITADGRLL